MAEQIKPPEADGIDVYCSHGAIWTVDQISPHPRNPNHHPPSQIELLGKVIESRGWRLPITVSALSKRIIRGHARYEAAILKGWKEVPVDIQHYDSEEEEMADLVADNRIAELAQMSQDELFGILSDLDAMDGDLELAGFSADEWSDLQGQLNPPSLDDLEDEYGDPDESDFWPILRFKISPALQARFESIQSEFKDEAATLDALVSLWEEEHGKNEDTTDE